MAENQAQFHVMRRVARVGQPADAERCASFMRPVEAEAFVLAAIAPFAERGTEAGRWWCQEKDNRRVDYWIESALSHPAGQV